MNTDQKLIIIRGNSGSGKSSLAKLLRKELGGKVAIVGQDTLRRGILMEKGGLENTDIIGLLEQTAVYCLGKGYTVIVEGILSKPKYKDMLVRLMDTTSASSAFYIDVSFEESLRRHKTKTIASEVSEEKLRSWYQPKNYLDVPGEFIVHESLSLDEMLVFIKEKITKK